MTKHTISEAKILNKQKGHYFFEADTMRFFHSHICTDIIREKYFITSEYMDEKTPKKYTIRRINWDNGNIITVSECQKFNCLEAAKNAIFSLSNED